MQTSFSPLSHPPELFTRERRLSRMRQFFEMFERTAAPVGADLAAESLPVRFSPGAEKSAAWTSDGPR
jgi:hypothetical protein